ncbi:hypothetical protein HBH53_109450 [Parastagonospora nodorum]|nr:hypothetical protein HBH53_109450 [Parastagonospora nodorum]KAH5113939.1 hypothetical protein HBH71_152490 [Parastagonospora nodorum]KAH5429012.1 hypothetical protein HBI47_113850 [Parastagonospora nodorum]KAH5538296.1 hypothetical protein HBI27_133500 [Parastagonospora nodorum]KAH5598324.1 hypothetical protein HBI45_162920 [Parastagonospora nodorum]
MSAAPEQFCRSQNVKSSLRSGNVPHTRREYHLNPEPAKETFFQINCAHSPPLASQTSQPIQKTPTYMFAPPIPRLDLSFSQHPSHVVKPHLQHKPP